MLLIPVHFLKSTAWIAKLAIPKNEALQNLLGYMSNFSRQNL